MKLSNTDDSGRKSGAIRRRRLVNLPGRVEICDQVFYDLAVIHWHLLKRLLFCGVIILLWMKSLYGCPTIGFSRRRLWQDPLQKSERALPQSARIPAPKAVGCKPLLGGVSFMRHYTNCFLVVFRHLLSRRPILAERAFGQSARKIAPRAREIRARR